MLYFELFTIVRKTVYSDGKNTKRDASKFQHVRTFLLININIHKLT